MTARLTGPLRPSMKGQSSAVYATGTDVSDPAGTQSLRWARVLCLTAVGQLLTVGVVSSALAMDTDNDGIDNVVEGAPDIPASCQADGILIIDLHDVYEVDLVTGSTSNTPVAVFNDDVNAAAYNPFDGTIWAGGRAGVESYLYDPITYEEVGTFPMDFRAFSGAIDLRNKTYYAFNGSRGEIWDADPNSPTYKTMLGDVGGPPMTAPDIIYDSISHRFYGVASDNPPTFMALDPEDGAWEILGTVENMESGTYGAGFSRIDGVFYFGHNQNGEIYEIDSTAPGFPDTISANLVATGPTTSGNDGARCAYLDLAGNPIQVDTDGDGTPDFMDLDSDNDGIPDAIEGDVDTDGDGLQDFRDVDSNNDGIPDSLPEAPEVTSQLTNDSTPVISGNATVASGETLSVEVNGVTYTEGDGNLVLNPNGTWNLSIPAGNAIADGVYEVLATVTGPSGLSNSDSTVNELIVDTTAPAAPAVTMLTTASGTPVISGTATVAAGETLTVEVNGVTYTEGDGNLAVNSNGTWELAIPTADQIADGNYEVVASVTDAAGNVVTDPNTNDLIVDTTAPAAPAVTSQITNDDTPVISGAATVGAGETLTVEINGVTYVAGDGNLIVSPNGIWSLSIPAVDAIADGVYEVTATVTDAAGNTASDPTANELTVDTTAPAAPLVTMLTTDDDTPVISGTATVGTGETLTVEVNGVTYTDGDGNLVLNPNGTWALSIPAGNEIADGNYEVVASVTDAAGNVVTDPNTNDLIIDTTAPAAPAVTSLTTDDDTPVISGTATVGAGETLTVEVDGVTYTEGDGNLVLNPNGTWALTIPAGNEISDGVYEVTATVTDAAGNTASDPTANDLTVDTTAPAAPSVTMLTTASGTPVISGTATVGAGETLIVEVNGVTYTEGDGNLVLNPNGTWAVTIPTGNEIADGVYEVTATVTDAAGNAASDPTTNDLTVDSTAPVAPAVTMLTTDSGTPVISGTATVGAGETLTVEVNGVTYTEGDGNLAVNSDGTWDLTIPAGDQIADGNYEVVASITDAAGNVVTDPNTNDLIVDTTAPAAPAVTSLTTGDDTPVITGTATVGAGETLTVEVDGVTYTEGDGNLVLNPNGTWALTIPAGNEIADGVYEVTATVTDAAGNAASDPTANDLTVDTTAPAAPAVTMLITDSGTPVISGTATVGAGETLTVEVNGVTYTEGDGNLVLNPNGTWALSIPAGDQIADGNYEVVASVTDTAGNVATDPNTNDLIVDTTAPAAPAVTSLTTDDDTPVISGTATVAPGETLTVEVNGVTYVEGDGNLIVNPNGIWSLSIPASDAIGDGVYDVTATVTDAAGNAATDPTANDLTVDTTAPAVPAVTSQITSDTTPIIVGSASVLTGESLSVEVNGVTYTQGDGNLVVNANDTWSLAIPAADTLAETTYDVTATVTDAAGNTATDVSSDELIVDATAPVPPTVTALNTDSGTPVISGTASLGSGDILEVEVNGVTYTEGDGNLEVNSDGTWDLTIPPGDEIADGNYEVVASVTDAAGNVITDPNTNDLIVDTTAPAAPAVTSLTTSDDTPVISGTATVGAGETLTVDVNGVTYTEGDGNLVLSSNGTWTLSIPVGDEIADGVYEVTATVTDAAGNAATDPAANDLTVDSTAPAAPAVTMLTTDSGTPVISGTATVGAGETLTVEVNGVTYTEGDGNLVLNANGTWNLTIPASDEIADGTYEVVASVTDAAGNVITDPNTNDLIVDTTAPAAPVVTMLTTDSGTPVISGTASVGAGETFTVAVNGVTYTEGDGNLVLNPNGTWDLTIPAGDQIDDGTYEVVASVTDAAGNVVSDVNTDDLIVDTTAPAVPAVTAQITSDTTPIIVGTATVPAGETLSVEVNGVSYVAGEGDLVLNPNGTWALTIPASDMLADGTYDVTATVTDAAGNTSVEVTRGELVVDASAPALPTVTAQTTNNGAPVISGTASIGSGDTLSVEVNGVTYTQGDGNLVVNPDGTWDLTIPSANALPDDVYEVVATVVDAAGNSVSDQMVTDLTIDTADPVVPTVVSQTTADDTPVITGRATVGSGETLMVEVDGVIYTEGDGNLELRSNGTWELTIPAGDEIADGNYDVTATITDAAGNVSTDPSAGELTINTSVPGVPVAEPLTTTDSSPVLSGTADLEPGDTLSVEVNGVTYTQGDGNLVVNPDGTWELTIPDADALPVGVYPINATITDAQGNTTPAVSPADLVIEAEADFDGDGIPDAIDLDDDNDGIPDTTEGEGDSDGDGFPDLRDLDSDNDGLFDILEVGGDDVDNDGRVDNMRDEDDNGLSDDLQIVPFTLIDTDGDLVPDYLDLDSDNDGLTDLFESGGIDDDFDGRIDDLIDENGDGADDVVQMTTMVPRDTDQDGVPNHLDLDSDNDGASDEAEASPSADVANPLADSDRDGIPDSVDADFTGGRDTDDDGIDDSADASFGNGPDTDGDGILDSADPDANGDGLADDGHVALTSGEDLPDLDGNGVADVLEPNGDDAQLGQIRTGLDGNAGCSISGPGTSSKDPLFALLMAGSALLWWRRRSGSTPVSVQEADRKIG